MNDRPLTWFLVTALGLWGLWMWRTHRLGSAAGTGAPLAIPPFNKPGMPKIEPLPGGGAGGNGGVIGGAGPTAYGLDSFGGMLR